MSEGAVAAVPDFARVENGALAGRFVAQFWQPILKSDDVAPGRARRVKILGKHYTVYRGEDGKARVVQDRCPHRGTSLAYGWVEGNGIRCRYHGWQFDGDGQGQDFPAETATYASRICLETYPARDYLGMIFAFLGEGEPPEFLRFPELEDEGRGRLLAQAVVLPYNFFQRIENDHDDVHPHFVHRQMETYGYTEIPRMTARETEYGLVSIANRSEGPVMEAHGFMPNILFREVPIAQSKSKSKLTIHLAWRVPIDDVSTYSVMINRVSDFDDEVHRSVGEVEDPGSLARRIMAGELTLEDVPLDHPMLAIVQDTVAIGGQGVIADRSAEHLGQSDRGIAVLRRIWAREMDKLERGEPLTQRRRPDDFAFNELPEYKKQAAE